MTERRLIIAYMRHMATLRPEDANGLLVIASDIEADFHLDPELNPEAGLVQPQAPPAERHQLAARINAKLAELGPLAEVGACVYDIAPGWEYVEKTKIGGPPQIELTRFAPEEPL